MLVEQIMSQPPIACGAGDTLNTAAQLMWEHDCGVIPVLGGDHRVKGIVTDRDICMAAYTQGKTLNEIPVQVAMAEAVTTCRPGDSLEEVENVMSEQQLRRLPVVNDAGQLVGMLSISDVARELAASKKKGVVQSVLKTVAAICTPRHQSIELAEPERAERPAPRATA